MPRHLNSANYVLRPFKQFMSACVLQAQNCVQVIRLPSSFCNKQEELTYSLASCWVPAEAEHAEMLVAEITFMQVSVTRNFKCQVKWK